MAKKEIDYSKLKALSQQIIECIGDTDIGENPDLPDRKPEKGSFDEVETADLGSSSHESQGEQEPLLDFIGKEMGDKKDEQGEDPKKKKNKDSQLALMGSMLASRVK